MPKSPEIILLRGPNFIGDHIMARSFYAGLRRLYPQAYIVFAGVSTVTSLAELTLADEVHTIDSSERVFPLGVLRGGFSLRARCFDLGICLPASYSSSLFLLAAGAKERVGFAQSGSEIFLTSSMSWTKNRERKHKAGLYLSLLEFISAKPFPLLDPASPIVPKEKYFVLAPGASLPLREWPYIAELCKALRESYPDHRIYLVGGKGERKWSTQVARLNDLFIVDRIGQTTLSEVRELCLRARLVFANDSGIAHLAATLSGAPTIVFFGPGDPIYVRPHGLKVEVMRTSVACSPCESTFCHGAFGHQVCLRSLSVEAVLEKTRETLSFD